MHKVLLEIGDGTASSTATIGHWSVPASTFRWVTAGDEPPFRITADGQITRLEGELPPPLGTGVFPERPHTNQARLDKAERPLLLSESFTHQLDDDATIIVLAPSGMIGPSE
jgi:hypothetical protein